MKSRHLLLLYFLIHPIPQEVNQGRNKPPEVTKTDEKWNRKKWEKTNSWKIDFKNGTIISGDSPPPRLFPEQKFEENNTHVANNSTKNIKKGSSIDIQDQQKLRQ